MNAWFRTLVIGGAALGCKQSPAPAPESAPAREPVAPTDATAPEPANPVSPDCSAAVCKGEGVECTSNGVMCCWALEACCDLCCS